MNKFDPTPENVLEAVEAVNELGKDADILKPTEVFHAPKPVARPRKKDPATYVTNTAFRDHEGLRNLQRDLHRNKNQKGTK